MNRYFSPFLLLALMLVGCAGKNHMPFAGPPEANAPRLLGLKAADRVNFMRTSNGQIMTLYYGETGALKYNIKKPPVQPEQKYSHIGSIELVISRRYLPVKMNIIGIDMTSAAAKRRIFVDIGGEQIELRPVTRDGRFLACAQLTLPEFENVVIWSLETQHVAGEAKPFAIEMIEISVVNERDGNGICRGV